MAVILRKVCKFEPNLCVNPTHFPYSLLHFCLFFVKAFSAVISPYAIKWDLRIAKNNGWVFLCQFFIIQSWNPLQSLRGGEGKSLVLKEILCIEVVVGNELQSQGWLLASVCVAFPFFTTWGTPVALRRGWITVLAAVLHKLPCDFSSPPWSFLFQTALLRWATVF